MHNANHERSSDCTKGENPLNFKWLSVVTGYRDRFKWATERMSIEKKIIHEWEALIIYDKLVSRETHLTINLHFYGSIF